jgi:hypothetical protein
MSSLKLLPSDNISTASLTTDEMPSTRNSPNYSRPTSSVKTFHPEWITNPVLILKKNTNEWRMCVDYTDLNKHCPKDPFGLPRIDQVIDTTGGCDLLYFLDCYSGYHRSLSRKKTRRRHVHHLVRRLWLHDNVVRVEERRRHLPASYPDLLQEAFQQERRSLCG